MILRSITKHLSSQNWFAVFLDFAIVVLGILIALQITNWNEERADRVEEKRIVLRLLEEANQSVLGIENAVADTDLYLSTARRLHAILLSGEIEGVDVDVFGADLQFLGGWPPAGFVSATLDQVIASGAIEKIRSSVVLDAIASYHAQVETRKEGIQNVGIMNLDHDSALRDLYDIDYSSENPSVVTPIADIITNVDLRRRVAQFVRTYSVMDRMHKGSVAFNHDYKIVLMRYAKSEGWVD